MARAEFEIDSLDDGAVLSLSGDWTTSSDLRNASRRLAGALKGREVRQVRLDDLGRFDTAGALVLVQAADTPFDPSALSGRADAERLYALVAAQGRESAEDRRRPSAVMRAFAKVGMGVHDAGVEVMLSLAFLGRLVASAGGVLANPARIRPAAWVSHIERAGLDAIPIVALTSFFIGAVVAFIGADLLGQFGAGVFAVELIAISVLREFAVVITSVLLAGRSSSSFAAEIGSMKMNQEVDAMRVMGVDPFQALVIPRLAALLLMLPLLTFVAMVSGLLGGMLVSWSQLGLGPNFFLQRLTDISQVGNHLFVGLIKAPVFAIVVAMIGCRQGMAVAGDVESLGRRVTAAVVQAIFAIVLLDAVFALIFLKVGI